ncbi:hypothetical protein FQR65_LT12658 [Abscondita terminalis]|nr:hypothetical protein FQR65_LT12658 [Abscondita terminalis]
MVGLDEYSVHVNTLQEDNDDDNINDGNIDDINVDNEIETSTPSKQFALETTKNRRSKDGEQEAVGSSESTRKSYVFSVRDISQIPQATSIRNSKRKANKSEELTGTLNMEEQKAKAMAKMEKERTKGLRLAARQTKMRLPQSNSDNDSRAGEEPFKDA